MKLNVPVVLALVIGSVLSMLAYAATRGWEDDRTMLRNEREALVQTESLRQEISSSIEAVISIKALFSASIKVERAEFGAFAEIEIGEGHSGIQALEWVPRVAAADRADFEAAARDDGLAGFIFTERETQGRMVAVAPRAEYYPVYFVEPFAGNEAAAGFDLGSDPTRLAALEKARDSGKIVATKRITLVQEIGDQYGFLVFIPIYRPSAPADTVEARRATLLGFGIGVLRVGDIVESALMHIGRVTDTMDMFVFDTTAPAGQQILYPKSATVENPADIDVAGCVNTPIGVGGRDWLVVHCPRGAMAAIGHWQSWVALIAGLTLTGMLMSYLLLMLRQTNKTNMATERLRTSEKRYRDIFDNAHDMIQSVDREGRFVFVNQAWIAAMGYTMDDLADINAVDLITAESKAHCQEVFKACMAGNPRNNVPVTFIRKDGRLLEAEGNIAPQISAGRVVATQGIFRDITERMHLEEQLRQAQKMEAVGQLTGGIAHDFNNLLAIIIGNVELLEDRLGSEDKLLNAVLRTATRGAELTHRLLAFSRQQSLRPQVIDLEELISGMSQMLGRTLGETTEIVVRADPNLWAALADPGQVENALLNLVLNARDVMPSGGKLTIECLNTRLDGAYVAKYPGAKTGDYVVLAVSDDGSGMTAEVQAHAFEPFFTTKEVSLGAGLGLSMVYGFARQSGGHVNIYSEEGKGTTVTLYLPRAEEMEQRNNVNKEEDIPRGRGEVILVIEDDPDVRAMAARMLEGLGYRVIDVPETAIANNVLAGGITVDLVLSDVVLPGGTSGPEFAEEIRTTYPGLKIIFMSGYPAEATKHDGFPGATTDQVLLNKPFLKRQLAKAIRDALN